MRYVGRIAGIVSYADNTHSQFAAHLDERGIVSLNDATDSNQTILEVQTANNWLESTLDLVSSTLALNPTGSAAKTVTDAVLHFSGRVARTDNTWEDFGVQYEQKTGGPFKLNSSGATTVYDEFTDPVVKAWLGTIVGGEDNVTP